MEKQKRYAELLARLNGRERKISEVSAEIEALGKKQATLAEEALRDEVLENSGWKGKKERAEKLREEIRVLEYEVEMAKKAVVILKAELKTMTDGVLEEIRGQFRPVLIKALKTYIEQLKGAAAAAAAVRNVTREGDDLIVRFGIDQKLAIEWSGSAIEFNGPNSREPMKIDTLIEQVRARCKENGLDVE